MRKLERILRVKTPFCTFGTLMFNTRLVADDSDDIQLEASCYGPMR